MIIESKENNTYVTFCFKLFTNVLLNYFLYYIIRSILSLVLGINYNIKINHKYIIYFLFLFNFILLLKHINYINLTPTSIKIVLSN